MTKANTASPKKSLEIPSVTHRFFVALQRAYAKIFKIQKNLCAFFDQTASDKACAHDKRTKREKERPERATSPQPRATPWVSVYKPLRPVRAKVWANGWLLLLPLQGVGVYALIPRVVPWAVNWLPFQGAPFRALFVYHVRMLRHLLFGKKSRLAKRHQRPRSGDLRWLA